MNSTSMVKPTKLGKNERMTFSKINEVIDMAFCSGYSTIKLSVQDNNMSGYPFWQKLGFKSVKRTKCDGFYNILTKLKRSQEKKNENRKIT